MAHQTSSTRLPSTRQAFQKLKSLRYRVAVACKMGKPVTIPVALLPANFVNTSETLVVSHKDAQLVIRYLERELYDAKAHELSELEQRKRERERERERAHLMELYPEIYRPGEVSPVILLGGDVPSPFLYNCQRPQPAITSLAHSAPRSHSPTTAVAATHLLF